MAQIRYEIPDELHRKFKARAALEGITLQALLVRLISEAVGEGK